MEALGKIFFKAEMAAKVFFLFVAVLVLFEAQAALYRRKFFDPGSQFMRGEKQNVFVFQCPIFLA